MNNNSNWLKYKCANCNSPAFPVNGVYFYCPHCGWQPKVKSNGNHAVF